MQFKLFSALALGGVLATTGSAVLATTGDSCDTGPILCCKDVQLSGSDIFKTLSGSLESLLPLDPNVPIGITCTPIVSAAEANTW